MLLSLVDEHGTNWSKIGKILERLPLNVRDRYREIDRDYTSGELQPWCTSEFPRSLLAVRGLSSIAHSPGVWTNEENALLRKLVKKTTGIENPSHLLSDIQWGAISVPRARSRRLILTVPL